MDYPLSPVFNYSENTKLVPKCSVETSPRFYVGRVPGLGEGFLSVFSFSKSVTKLSTVIIHTIDVYPKFGVKTDRYKTPGLVKSQPSSTFVRVILRTGLSVLRFGSRALCLTLFVLLFSTSTLPS